MRKDILAVICPDVHGRTFWKEIIEKYDGSVPFIFLGDYTDPYQDEGITHLESIENFKEIWKFKEKWGDNIITLIGNHDLSYYDKQFRTCRFSYEISEWYNDFLTKNWEQFKFVYEINLNDKKYLFSHAGINPYWLDFYNFERIYSADYINSLFKCKKHSFGDYSFYRGGYGNAGSPVWSDIREYANLNEDDIDKNVVQIVGHTQLIKDSVEFNNVHCIDSRQLFVLTNDGKIEPYRKKEEEI
jgi:hypothetical protein